jgi:hypothetical protein
MPDMPDRNDDAILFTSEPGAAGTLRLDYGLAGDLDANFFNWPEGDGRTALNYLELIGFSTAGTIFTTQLISGDQQAEVTRVSTGDDITVFGYESFMADNPNFTNARLQQIDRVSLIVQGVPGGTVVLQHFTREGLTTIPELSTLSLAAIIAILGGLLFVRRDNH